MYPHTGLRVVLKTNIMKTVRMFYHPFQSAGIEVVGVVR